jgi:hypothetical protein
VGSSPDKTASPRGFATVIVEEVKSETEAGAPATMLDVMLLK